MLTDLSSYQASYRRVCGLKQRHHSPWHWQCRRPLSLAGKSGCVDDHQACCRNMYTKGPTCQPWLNKLRHQSRQGSNKLFLCENSVAVAQQCNPPHAFSCWQPPDLRKGTQWDCASQQCSSFGCCLDLLPLVHPVIVHITIHDLCKDHQLFSVQLLSRARNAGGAMLPDCALP